MDEPRFVPFPSGQLVRIVGHTPLGDIGRISGQRGTTDDCGLPGPAEPIYHVWLMGHREPRTFKHSELQDVEAVRIVAELAAQTVHIGYACDKYETTWRKGHGHRVLVVDTNG